MRTAHLVSPCRVRHWDRHERPACRRCASLGAKEQPERDQQQRRPDPQHATERELPYKKSHKCQEPDLGLASPRQYEPARRCLADNQQGDEEPLVRQHERRPGVAHEGEELRIGEPA